jgi:hypothetical protein
MSEVQEVAAPSVESEILAVKNIMRNNLVNLYAKFIEDVKTFSGNPVQLHNAYIRFDEGHMWMHQAIANAELSLEPVSIPEAPVECEELSQAP